MTGVVYKQSGAIVTPERHRLNSQFKGGSSDVPGSQGKVRGRGRGDTRSFPCTMLREHSFSLESFAVLCKNRE